MQQGLGIVVTLRDNEYKDIEYSDLLILVNELRLAGAEAISINDERVVTRSDLRAVSGNLILLNQKRLSSPYIVKAIGNQQYLESGLTQKEYGYIDRIIKAYEKTATVERSDNITILKYEGEMNFKYTYDEETSSSENENS